MASKWAHLKGKIPTFEPTPTYGYSERLRAAIDQHKQGDPETVARSLNDARESRDAVKDELSHRQFAVDALTTALVEMMDARRIERITVDGYTFTPTPDPYPQVVDRNALREWAQANSPEILSVHPSTLEGIVKAALAPRSTTALPPGVDLYLKPGLRRTKT